jgi:predicted NAD-dependent protein-ADP-ribosyltransferase YbiA (DUF1768 family)/protein-tyrosine phosphatase
MERCSYFIENKALFGSYPTQETVNYLQSIGVVCFIDLTNKDETNIITYQTDCEYINYPIVDRKIPSNWKTFAKLILNCCNKIKKLKTGEKIYIHCKGGHGRSGILVACILCHYNNLTVEEALRRTNKYHSERIFMKEKWRKIGSPQGKKQKDFVYKFFKYLKYKDINFNAITDCFSNHSNYKVKTELGTFPTAYFAYQAYKDKENIEYLEKMQSGINTVADKPKDWERYRVEYMYSVLKNKFIQNVEIKEILLNTGMRPLVKISEDSFWADGGNGRGKNIHGKLLERIRYEFFEE